MLESNGMRAVLGRFRRDQRGGAFTLVAVSFLVIIGVAALAVDLGSAYSLEARLQNAADAAALAGARELPDATQANAKAQEYATKNMGTRFGQVVDTDDVAVGTWDDTSRAFTVSTVDVNAIQVTAKMAQENGNPAPTFFGRIFGMDSMDISASAIATGGTRRCVYVLGPKAKSTLRVAGNAQVDLDCGVAVRSYNAEAFTVVGSGCLDATSIEVVGGSLSDNCGQPASTGVRKFRDPLRYLPPPTWGPCDYTTAMTVTGTETLSPGTYCAGVAIEDGANVTLDAGEFVFSDAPLTINGGATVNGDGVTLYFTEGGLGNGVLTVNGGANVTLTAPSNGPRAAVLFYSDRNAEKTVIHKFTGGATMDLTGIVYASNQELRFSGGADITGSCVTIISRKLNFVGNTEITASNNCPIELSEVMSEFRLVR